MVSTLVLLVLVNSSLSSTHSSYACFHEPDFATSKKDNVLAQIQVFLENDEVAPKNNTKAECYLRGMKNLKLEPNANMQEESEIAAANIDEQSGLNLSQSIIGHIAEWFQQLLTEDVGSNETNGLGLDGQCSSCSETQKCRLCQETCEHFCSERSQESVNGRPQQEKANPTPTTQCARFCIEQYDPGITGVLWEWHLMLAQLNFHLVRNSLRQRRPYVWKSMLFEHCLMQSTRQEDHPCT